MADRSWDVVPAGSVLAVVEMCPYGKSLWVTIYDVLIERYLIKPGVDG